MRRSQRLASGQVAEPELDAATKRELAAAGLFD